MKFIYGICYYYGKNNKSNLQKHLDVFKKISIEDKEFFIVVMTDNMDKKSLGNIKNDLPKLLKDFRGRLIPCFNWGGTIAALWTLYQTLSKNYKKSMNDSTLVSMFEEDFIPINDNWLEDSVRLLIQNNIYVGESMTGKIKSGNDDGRITGKRWRNAVRLGNPEVWTDGGYYFTSASKLMQIDKKIGVFHKGNQKTLYNHDRDGIDYGEVGFPTLLYNAGFRFAVLPRNNYFIHTTNINHQHLL